ncbi:MAG: class I SAM-dependent methyltransferase [Acidobacteriota bacterium]
MAHRICPWWLGYALINPLRRWREDPVALLGPHVREGMVVLEPGCGMGYFTVPLARMVGPGGRVIAVDLQERMLAGLMRRARKAGVSARVEPRRAAADRLGIDDLADKVDLALALHMVHEVPDRRAFFAEVARALRPGGTMLVIEPKGHVTTDEFETTLAAAAQASLAPVERPASRTGRAALLRRPEGPGGGDRLSAR